MNGLINLDETCREYSPAPSDDLITFWRSKVKVTAGHRGGEGIYVDASYVRDGTGCTKKDRRDGLTKNRENAQHVPAPEQKMFRDWTDPTLFRAGTVPETVPVRSLFKIMIVIIVSGMSVVHLTSLK